MKLIRELLPSSSILLLAALVTAGCGGGGSIDAPHADDNDDQGPVAPDAVIAFPPPYAETDADTLFMRGTTTADEAIASVSVNGFEALSLDGYATWEVKIPLDLGKTVLTTTLVTAAGEVIEDPDLRVVRRRSPLVGNPVELVYSQADGPVLWYLDDRQVLRHDLLTGELEVLSGPEQGHGPAIESPVALVVDEDETYVYVLDHAPSGDRILQIKTNNGNRIVLDPPVPGQGSELAETTDMAYAKIEFAGEDVEVLYLTSEIADRIFVVWCSTGEIAAGGLDGHPVGTTAIDIHMDPNNNDHLLAVLDANGDLLRNQGAGLVSIASVGDGHGDIWSQATDLEIMADRSILVTDRHTGEVYQIHPQTFERTTLSQAYGAHGMEFQDLCAVESFKFDGQPIVAVMDRGLDVCAGLDLMNPEWEEILSTGVAQGASMNLPIGLVQVQDGFIASALLPGEIVHIDRETGNRTALAPWDELPFAHLPMAICVDEAAGVAYFPEPLMGSIVALDLSTGEMAPVSGQGLGEGPNIEVEGPVGLVHDGAEQRLLLALGDQIIAIDLQSGDRFVLSGPQVGAGPVLDGAVAMVLDAPRGRALVAGIVAVYSVDLQNGDRQMLSGLGIGGGPALKELSALAYSPEAAEFLVLNQAGTTLLRIEEATGNRNEAFVGEQVGPAVDQGLALQWDAVAETAYMVDFFQGRLKVFDLARGQWMTLSR